ncbi:MAG: hypothetical protein AMS21_02830 [Gemmatimonas sp. SG8_38_2]|nr:MAG: hypothetical protein AMS21_02830 [Gemmatimonas sp. SG8_38_2]
MEAVFSAAGASDAEIPLVTRERHSRQLRCARAEIDAFAKTRSGGIAPEVTATHLRAAAQALEELLGVIAPEDLLTRVFSEFCIGK